MFLARAYELALRGRGNTSPNPNVGAVFVRDGDVIGEGYHHRAGEAHAEIEALRAAGDVRGATLYVTLEPCAHEGRTGSCARALAPLGLARVVVGTLDPNPQTHEHGVSILRDAGVLVDIAGSDEATRIVAPFSVAIAGDRPYLALKMAVSLDGFVAASRGARTQLTGEAWSAHVRELRASHDAVMVGAGTVRIDDPLLTVRPPRARLRPALRVVACETEPIPLTSLVLEAADGYERTIVLAPASARAHFSELETVADVLYSGTADDPKLNLASALCALRERGVTTVLCEGGPTFASALIAAGLVDRIYWAIAPVTLGAAGVPALSLPSPRRSRRELTFDGIERFGNDVMLTGSYSVCSAD